MTAKRLDNRAALSIFLLVVFLLSLLAIDWQEGVIHGGGFAIIKQMSEALVNPDFSLSILETGLKASWQTFVYALISVSISVVVGFVFAIIASGIIYPNRLLMRAARGILGFLRAIHELVWAWLFVAAIGLNPLGAVFAVAIPYAGALGKVYADLLMEVSQPIIETVETTGANRWQLLIYVYLPEALNEMVSYTLYRLECAIRSSSVLSFVGLGGLGFQIQLAMNDMNFSLMWIYIYFLIGLVLLVDIWGNRFRAHLNKDNTNQTKFSIVLLTALSIAAWVFIFAVDGAEVSSIFSSQNADYLSRFIAGLLGVNDTTPAYLNGDLWTNALKLTVDTVIMSIIAIGIAVIGSLPFMLPAARNFKDGRLLKTNPLVSSILFYVSRFILLVTRALPELLWALIFVFIFKPGIFPGALALGVHNIGVLGKLCSEVIEEFDERSVRNIATTGASRSQLLLYGIMPEIMIKLLNYVLYRWEVIIRSTIVVGLVGAGGLGVAMRLAMSFFKYSEITLYMICYLIIVFMADTITDGFKSYIKVEQGIR